MQAETIVAGLLYALGYLTGLVAFAQLAKQRGLSTQGIWALTIAALIGGLAGANLAQILATGGGAGKTIIGAVAAGYLSVIYIKRHLGIKRPTGDLFAFGISAGEAVGRLGCFVGGCCYGKITNVPWAVFEHGAHRHPTQLYLSIAAAATFAAIYRFNKMQPPENAVFFLQGLLMFGSRFVIEFFRADAIMLGVLTEAQWACLIAIAFSDIN